MRFPPAGRPWRRRQRRSAQAVGNGSLLIQTLQSWHFYGVDSQQRGEVAPLWSTTKPPSDTVAWNVSAVETHRCERSCFRWYTAPTSPCSSSARRHVPHAPRSGAFLTIHGANFICYFFQGGGQLKSWNSGCYNAACVFFPLPKISSPQVDWPRFVTGDVVVLRNPQTFISEVKTFHGERLPRLDPAVSHLQTPKRKEKRGETETLGNVLIVWRSQMLNAFRRFQAPETVRDQTVAKNQQNFSHKQMKNTFFSFL